MIKSTGEIERDDLFDFLRFDDPSTGRQWDEDDAVDMTDGTAPLTRPYARAGNGKKTETLS